MSRAATVLRVERSEEAQVLREEISRLSDQLIEHYRTTGRERARLSSERGAVDGGVLHGEIEIFADDIQGYATSIAKRGKVRQPGRAMRLLLAMNGARLIAHVHRCERKYPRLKHYVRDSDALRRMVIEYLERYAG